MRRLFPDAPLQLSLALLTGFALLVAAACADADFDAAPDDRGAAAAQSVGAVEREEQAHAQAEEDASAEQATEEQLAPEQQAQGEAQAQADETAQPDQAEEPAQEPAEQVVEEEPAASDAGDPRRGEELFFANGCNVCHGDRGQGGIGPTNAQTRLTVDQVIEQYRNPRGIMPSFGEDVISDADVRDIHAWLQTLPLPEVIVPGEGTPQ